VKANPIETISTTVAVLAAIMVAAPVVSIGVLALQPAPDVWSHLIAYVLLPALRDTALLLAGVGVVTLLIGAGTAWLISLYDFPGRRLLIWLMPLPLAIPTYIAA
jgi:iron(III) transport system permease protein